MFRDRRGAAAAAFLIAGFAAPARADEPAAIEVSVRAEPAPAQPGRAVVSVEQARRVPGGASDPLKAIESMPGVGRTAFDGGRLVVWGAAPGDTRVYVDGVEIPALFHGGGVRGVVSGDLVQSVELTPGAYGADYGRALGGAVRLRTRELPETGIHGVASADVVDAGATITAAIGDRLRVAVSGRASYLDRLVSAIAPRDVGDLVPIPRYRDLAAKVSVALRPAESLDTVLLGSSDEWSRAVASRDPAAVRRERTASSFHRAYMRYARATDSTLVEITPFIGQDRLREEARFGAVLAYREEVAWKYGLRASARVDLTGWLSASFGVDALATRAGLDRAGSLTIPAREGDLRVFGQPPGADVNADRWGAHILDAAPFLTADVKAGPVTITPGLRVDAVLIEASRATPRVGETPSIGSSRLVAAINPRLAVRYPVSRRVTLTASGGLYNQPPSPADLGAVFGTPALSLQRAVHVSAGQTARLFEGVSLEVTGYYELLNALVVRSRLPTPKLALALTQDGEGRSYGVQLLLRRQLRKGFFGWVSYTAGRSERRHIGDPRYRLFDEDRTHALAAVASYERDGWGVGARFRATTGAPRTPVVGSFHEVTSGQMEPVFGTQNSTRLPAFYQLDVRLGKKVVWPRATLEVYLDVLNVTFHKNAEEIVYSHDWAQKGYITGLPILAVLGARVEI